MAAAAPGRSEQPQTGCQRRCIASGAIRPKQDLLRFVVGPDGSVVADLAGTLPGRGLWLSPRRDMLEKACARNLFAKTAKAQVRVPDDLPEQVERSLRRRCLEMLGLAKRAGQAVAGFEKAKSWLAAGGSSLLIEASDAAPGGREKLAALGRAVRPGLTVCALFTAEELGRALGRGRAVHVVVAEGGIADRLLVETARLAAVMSRDERKT